MKQNANSSEIPREVLRAYRHTLKASEITTLRAAGYLQELRIMNCVQSGDENILSWLRTVETPSTWMAGKMSESPLRQAQYSAVSGITLITRYAVAGGLPAAEAYSLSDAYIQQIDTCTRPAAVRALLIAALQDFTHRVHLAKTRTVSNYPVARCIRYIDDNIADPLSLPALAAYCGVTPPYLSASFHRETGVTLSAYIRREKLKAAEHLLRQTDYSVQQVAAFLSFGTPSSFAASFRAQYGMTPSEWRRQSLP